MDEQLVELSFDITPEDSSIILRMDINRYDITNNVSRSCYMTIKRPTDRDARRLKTYISGGDFDTGLRLSVPPGTSTALIGRIETTDYLTPTVEKRLHPMTHDKVERAIRICKNAGWSTK